MTEAVNEAIARQYQVEVLSKGNLDLLDEIWAEELVHDDSSRPEAVDRAKRLQVTTNEVIAEDDLVVVCYTDPAIHHGDDAEIAPTSRERTWTGINVFPINCGQIVETWADPDRLGLLQQLEAPGIPGTPAAAPAS